MGVAIWRKLSQLKIPIKRNWIPAHSGIDGNERADKTAGAACALPQREMDTPLQTALAVPKRERKKKDKESFRECARFSNKQEETRLERADRVRVNQFRAGASSVSKATLYRMGKTDDDACTFCGEEETEKHSTGLSKNRTSSGRLSGSDGGGPARESQNATATTKEDRSGKRTDYITQGWVKRR